MKIATFPRVGQGNTATRWFALVAIAGLLLGAVSLKAQSSDTETTVTTLGGGPEYYNPGSNFGYSNSVYGTLYSQFHTPSGLAYDSFQNFLYVADRDNNAVRLIDYPSDRTKSETYTFAPYPPYVPTNLISQPVGVAVDASSDVFVLNRGKGTNGTVVEFDWLGDLIATNMTRLTNASGIALDTLGDIYVTTSNTVFKITAAGVSNVVVTITNAGTSLQGIVVKRSGPNAGKLAVCDSGRNGIYLIDPNTGAVTTNAGFNGAGDGTGNRNQGVLNANAQFFQPSGLAEAGDGSLIVADFGNHRVKVVTASGITTNLYGVASNLWWTGTTPCDEPAIPGWSDCTVWEPDLLGDVQARQPFGVAIGSDGTIYTTEDYYHIIRKVTGANIVAPLPPPPDAPTNLTATAGYGQIFLTWPASSGATNYNVKRSTTSHGETTIASTAGTSYTDTNVIGGTTYYYVVSAVGTGGEGRNSVEASATALPPLFNAPNGIALDNANANLFIADQSNNVIEQLNFGNNQTTAYLVAANGISRPVDVAVISGGNLFVLNQGANGNGTILEFDRFKNLLATNATGLVLPTAMTLDNSGNIFVAEQHGLVLEYTLTNGFPSVSNTLATVSTNGLVQLQGITILDGGVILVSDAGNHVIWQINPVSKAVSRFTGQFDSPGGTLGSAAFAQLNQPHKMIRALGDLTVVADDGNNRVVVVDDSGSVTNALVTTNSTVWFGRTNDPVVPPYYPWKPMTSPVGLALDNAGAVYSSETFYDNIRKTPGTGLAQVTIPQGTNNLTPPIITPNSGYYPMGQNIVVQSVYPVYYTTDGSTPTTNGSKSVTLVGNVGFIPWFNTTNDLTYLHLEAFYGTNSSAVVSGQSVATNNIGTPPGYNPNPTNQTICGGIGSSIVVPIVCNLTPNSQVKSFQLRYEVSPLNSPNTPVILPLSIFPTNDFVPVADAAQAGVTSYYEYNPYTLGPTNGLEIFAYSNIFFQHFAAVVMIEVQIPPNATNGEQYALNVLYPSATADGYSQNVPLTPMPQTVITVSDIPYTVGDSASDLSGGWYNAGTFGDDNLDNADVMQTFFAASGLRMPYVFSDVFNAMDAFPVDTAGSPGGDGQIRFLDWNTILQRSLRLDNSDWARAWSPGGNLVDVTTNLVNPAFQFIQPAFKNSPVTWQWYRQALVGGISVGNVAPGATVNVPVYVKLQYGSTLGGLQFRALVTPQNNAPAITNAPQFGPAGGVAAPSLQQAFKAGEKAFGWPLVPTNSFNYPSDSSNFLGWVSFTIPTTAQSGQVYTVSFANADGAPNMSTQYDLESRSAYVTVNGPAIPASICSDEWKIYFFGSTTNPLAADGADPYGAGIPNWMVYLAGTDPTDRASKFQFSSVSRQSGGGSKPQVNVQWLTAPGKAYEVQWSTNLANSSWNILATMILGNGTMTNCVDMNATSAQRYYRLHLLP